MYVPERIAALRRTRGTREWRASPKCAIIQHGRKTTKAPAPAENMANALNRWDEDGGAPAQPWPIPYKTGDLLEVERRVLECLGAALVSEWNDLPTDVQRRLFEHAAFGKSHDAAILKSQIYPLTRSSIMLGRSSHLVVAASLGFALAARPWLPKASSFGTPATKPC
jgi:hypothetical protein